MAHLIDGDMASNNGNWQWVASTGVDPAPYFRRLFNPTLQQRRFDPDGDYVRRWVPELAGVPDARLAEPWTMTARSRRRRAAWSGATTPSRWSITPASAKRALARYRAV